MASTQLQQAPPAGPKLAMAPTPGSTTPTVAMPTVAVEAPPAEPIYGTVIPNRVFVGGISRDTTESDLMIAFSAYGTVRSTKIIVDQDGFNKGYGFVTFETEEEAQRLQSVGKCVILRNRRLNIAPAFKKQQIRPKLQPIIETNGTVYFTTQPPPPPPTVNTIPLEQYATATYGPAGSVTEYTAATVPAIYQQAPAGVQYQPVYQYYSVPVNMPAVWPQNYYQDPQTSNSQTSIPQQTSWEFDGANNSSWRSS
ncbi:protein boule-like [Drosophila hydei]|uniref:Protein boule-like n=1 Tax=Drosophila hydei TaxID=7224 RepID=A0A6J1LFM3_DROHY|nr:protein boule-like [Drosophila hydei]